MTESTSSPTSSDDSPSGNSSSLTRNAATVSGLTLLSRVLGVFREALLASIFHLSWIMDAFVLAYQIPNLFRKLFGEGALSSAFIPVYTKSLEQDSLQESNQLSSTVLTLLGLVLITITAAGMLGAWYLPSLASGTSDPEWLNLFSSLLLILFPYTIIICLVAILGGMLNAHDHFAAPAAAPVVLNIVLVGTLVYIVLSYGYQPEHPKQLTYLIATMILVGGLLQFLLQIVPLARRNVKYHVSLDLFNPEVQKIGKLMVPSILGLSVLQLNLLLDSWIAKWLVPREGAIAALWFGNRIMQFPLALVGVAVSTAAFPRLSRKASQEDHGELARDLENALRLSLFLSIPASVGLLLLSEPSVELLYRYGTFGGEDTLRTSRVLLYYSMGIWAFCTYHLLTKAFYAIEDTKTPSIIAGGMVFLNALLNIALVLMTRSEIGIAISTSVTSILNTIILSWIFYRRLAPFSFAPIFKCLGRCSALSLVMGIGVILTTTALGPVSEGGLLFTIFTRLGVLVLPVLVGIVIYLGLSFLLGTSEMEMLLDQVKG